MRGNFTKKAEARWAAIPSAHREQIICNVWCVHCSAATTIVDFSGVMKSGDLLLEGSCKICGGSVARLIEGP